MRPTTTATDTVVDVSALEVLRGGRRVLPGVSLAVRRGVITVVLGRSGSGKTTLMRAIVGVQKVAGGAVTVLGQPAGTAALRRRIAYVTQAPSVYADLTVRENLEYFVRILDAPAGRIGTTIATVGLERQADQVVGTLSGGERSRCSLAVALLHDPELLVIDEPTVGLDPVLRGELWATFHALAEGGPHADRLDTLMDEAERCDELVLMREGRVVASGTPDALREETGSDTVERAFIALAERA